MATYQRLPVSFERGEGAWLWDDDGRRYLDAIAGLGVCALGHAHPEVARAVAEQAGTLVHTSNLVRIPWQEHAAGRLCVLAGMDRVFFGNSGAEAIECALKIARLAGHGRGVDKPSVIVMKHSFHGRTLAALSATGNRKVQAGFEPLVSGFIRVPYGDAAAVEQVAAHNREIAAVLVEPIQGEGGDNHFRPEFLRSLQAKAREWDAFFIVDEVQTDRKSVV